MTRLCGGAFLTLLSAVKRENAKATVCFLSRNYTLTDKGIMTALLRLMRPDYEIPNADTFRVTVSAFKACKKSYGPGIPLNDKAYTLSYHDRLLHDHQKVSAEMQGFVLSFLRAEEPEQMAWLGNALMEAIRLDDQTAAWEFFMDGGNAPINKGELLSRSEISLPALLACVWDCIGRYVADNTVGKSTIEAWAVPKETPNHPGTVRSDLGESVKGQYCFTTETLPETHPDPVQTPAGNGSLHQGQQPAQPWVPQGSMQFINQGGMMFCPGSQVHNINYFGSGSTGVSSLFEFQRLRKDYYSLIVLPGDVYSEPSISINVSCMFTEGMEKAEIKRFRKFDQEIQDILLSSPVIFASVNENWNEVTPGCMAVLGKIIDMKIQMHTLRMHWKPYCPIPQELLAKNCPDFGIYYCNLSTELDEAHWSVKPVPLVEKLMGFGINPYQLIR